MRSRRSVERLGNGRCLQLALRVALHLLADQSQLPQSATNLDETILQFFPDQIRPGVFVPQSGQFVTD